MGILDSIFGKKKKIEYSIIKEEEEEYMKYKTIDGNTAASEMAYLLSEVSAIYPITPSSVMAELVEQWASEKRPNIFVWPY